MTGRWWPVRRRTRGRHRSPARRLRDLWDAHTRRWADIPRRLDSWS